MEFTLFTGLDSLPESSNRLFAKAEEESFFFSRPWFENHVAAGLREDEVPLFACVIDDSIVLAMLPLVKRGDNNIYSLSNNFTSLHTLLLADVDDQRAILSCLARGLDQLAFDHLVLGPVADADHSINRLRGLLVESGLACHRYFRFYNWIHRLRGQTFREYMAARPARLRNTIERKSRRLEREHGYEIRLYLDDDLDQAMADYNDVYRASWKGGEYFRGFVDGLVRELAKPGWLRLAILYIAGRPAAAQIWFVVHGRASIFRLVFDEKWKVFSPGSILTRFLMEYVIDTDRVEEIDFLTGNEPYKQDWMSERRERWELDFKREQYSPGRVRQVIASLKAMLKKPKS